MIGLQDSGLLVKVYVDVMLLINFIMDFFILWATGKLTGTKARWCRLIAGASCGAIYSLVIFLPQSHILTSLAAKIICSIVMILFAFAPLSFRLFVRSIVYLYIISFVMGGAVIAAIYMTDKSPTAIQAWNGAAILANSFSYKWLTVGICVALIVGWGGISYLRKNWLHNNLLSTLVIHLQGHEVTMQALLDTGNQLVDPLTQQPVIVVEIHTLKHLLPEKILQAISEEELNMTMLSAQLDKEWTGRLRLIPFNSVGRIHGLMLGVRPDYIEVKSRGGIIKREDVIIGIINRNLTKEGKYQALLNSRIIQETM